VIVKDDYADVTEKFTSRPGFNLFKLLSMEQLALRNVNNVTILSMMRFSMITVSI
jgi:hypothetical protein